MSDFQNTHNTTDLDLHFTALASSINIISVVKTKPFMTHQGKTLRNGRHHVTSNYGSHKFTHTHTSSVWSPWGLPSFQKLRADLSKYLMTCSHGDQLLMMIIITILLRRERCRPELSVWRWRVSFVRSLVIVKNHIDKSVTMAYLGVDHVTWSLSKGCEIHGGY